MIFTRKSTKPTKRMFCGLCLENSRYYLFKTALVNGPTEPSPAKPFAS